MLFPHLRHRPVAWFPLQLIEIAEVAAGAIQEEVQDLEEQVFDGDSFGALFEMGKFVQQQADNTDRLHVLDEEGQTPSAGQTILGDFQSVNALAPGFCHALSPRLPVEMGNS